MGAVSFCDRGGYVCGDCYVTFLCDLFGGQSSTVMDGFADGLVTWWAVFSPDVHIYWCPAASPWAVPRHISRRLRPENEIRRLPRARVWFPTRFPAILTIATGGAGIQVS